MTRPYLLDVLVPLIHPVRALPGQVVAVLPGHPTHAVTVLQPSAGDWSVVRTGPPNYGALLTPLLSGVLSERTPGAQAALQAA